MCVCVVSHHLVLESSQVVEPCTIALLQRRGQRKNQLWVLQDFELGVSPRRVLQQSTLLLATAEQAGSVQPFNNCYVNISSSI